MSEPANPSALILLDHRYKQQQPPPPPQLVSPGGGATTSTSSLVREYRRGNWTLHETLVLINAKKLNDERRIKSNSTPTDPNKPQPPTNRSAELRWKWVENYCWNHGCQRSQNQCNDKWDNLLRDYKKVREYEARSDGSNDFPSYWKMEKHERKEKSLPSNLLIEVFQALNQVVQHRYPQRTSTTPPPQSEAPPPPPPPAAAVSETSNSSEAVRSERSESEPKRRKVESVVIGSSIVESATVLARTLLDCEEKKEKRHRDVIEIEERRIQIEETQNETNRQGILSLIAVVNNLSSAIEAVVSDRFRAGDRM